ncbi:hypothetical protein [Winogradskyella tangerina]|uniref:hypothetical protein n=1 Tax=Winogradskyella tangerina TaxID=2023240 RepID=UPI000DBE2232|nr:hypothetical protein [Winogradskyella tangerina]
MKKFIIIFFLVGCILNGNSQSKSESYKYVVVPLQYEFLKGKDKYRLNTQTRYLLKKEGFNVYFDEGEQLPEDLFKNRCLAMYADVHEVKGGFLKQKIKISFKDCYGQLLLESEEGASKEKNLNVAYKEALERAFVTLDFSRIENKTSPKEQDSENETATEEKVITEEPVQEEAEVIEVVETKETEVSQPEIEEEVVKDEKEVVNPKSEKSTVYYAQKIAGGFQLVDAEPKIIMVLLATASPDIFMVKDKNAMVLKKDGNWVYSENENGQMIEKPINIKF